MPAHAIMYGLDRNYVPHTRRDAHVSEDRHVLAGLTPAAAPRAPSILPIFAFTHIKESVMRDKLEKIIKAYEAAAHPSKH